VVRVHLAPGDVGTNRSRALSWHGVHTAASRSVRPRRHWSGESSHVRAQAFGSDDHTQCVRSQRGAPPPFGRPAGYENNLYRYPRIENPSRVITFGDGHSDIRNEWPNDRWWIWKYDAENSPGFNRLAQGDKGAVRHNRRSNYARADGSASLLDAGRIPCNLFECWWSVKAKPH